MNNVVQWNCRGLRANYTELQLLMTKFDPLAFCLQELLITDSYNFTNTHYSLYHKIPAPTNDKPTGGVGIMIRKILPHSSIALSTPLQAIACRVSTPQPLTICSVYLPPTSSWNHSDLLSLIAQLPRPILLLGDFNAHSTIWGCTSTDRKGLELEDFLLQSNLCLMNQKCPTYIHPATGSRSSIDLTFCDSNLLLDYSWRVHDDLCGSDHFPIILEKNSDTASQDNQRWKLKEADWPSFSTECSCRLSYDEVCNAEDQIEAFATVLLEIAETTIPKTSTKPRSIRNPWYNETCKSAVAARKVALKNFNSHPNIGNLDNFKLFRAKARRTIKNSKRDSWRSYVSKLTSKTPMKKIWNMVRRISGKNTRAPVSHLKLNGSTIEEPQAIANTLASTISHNSSSDHYSEYFQRIKTKEEKRNLNFQSTNKEAYNQPFSESELQTALHKANDTAVGPDNIHYQMLKHLPAIAIQTLLKIFNNIWITGKFPSSWSEATVIPIPKPGKDTTSPDNYRPIALTSCVCKTFERMINDRLIWYLEHNNLLSEYQSGFRKQRSTTDQLVRLESFIREAFVCREHVVSVFFDLEKAYDTTWKYGIMRDLSNAGLKGRMPVFISNFLANRNFRVRMGSYLSDAFEQEMGVPQGSILSVTLFILKINNIVRCIPKNIRCSLYVDDFVICYRSRSTNSVERQLQSCLYNIQSWADENGFKFSTTKTVCMHFCHQRKPHAEPDLKLYGNTIPVVKETKFLGLILDSKLTFIPHIKYLKDKCIKAMNLLRVVAHTDWGADSATLLKLYRTHIRSKLDYGCIIYGSARGSYLRPLDSIQNAALRTCLGAFRTSPIASVHVEANEFPIALRRDKLALQYILKLASNPNNPAYDCVFRSKFKRQFLKKPKAIPTLGFRMQQHLSDTGINLENIEKFSLSATPPWTMKKPLFNYSLRSMGNKNDIPPHLFQSKFSEQLTKFVGYVRIYTDGSKDGAAVAAAAVTANKVLKKRLPDHASIFSAEAQAILLSLDIADQSGSDKILILSDSLSCLQSIDNRNLQNPLILQISNRIHDLLKSGTELCFMWVPSHVGLSGNSAADASAKDALSLPSTRGAVPYSDFKPLVHSHILSRWQQSWNTKTNNKLHEIQPVIKPPVFYGLPRRDERIIHRLRIGHTYLTHSYLLKREQPPKCTHCQSLLSVEHILLHCTQYASIRRKHFDVGSLQELFDKVSLCSIIDFVKEAGVYYKL